MQAWGSSDHKTFVTLIRQTIHNSGHASSVRILLLELLFRPARLREHLGHLAYVAGNPGGCGPTPIEGKVPS